VYLPAGRWHDFWTGARYEGPGGVTLPAPLDRLPLLVRGGAILPMGPVMQYSGERPVDELTLLVYPDGASRFELYEDDGRSNAYLRGRHALTTIECAARPAHVTVTIGEPAGDRSVVPPGRRYVLRLRIEQPVGVTVDEHGELPRREASGAGLGWWVDAEGFTLVRLPAQPAVRVTIRTRT
jgi:alpha-glucosidase